MIPAIDTHVHIWNLARLPYDWLAGDTSILNRTYTLDELNPCLQHAGVTQGLLVQAANQIADTHLMLEMADANPWIIGIVGWLPLSDPGATGRMLSDLYGHQPKLRGVRHLIHTEADPKWLLQDTVLESLQLLADANLSYDVVGTTVEHLQVALTVAEQIPGLRLILDHLNQPPIARQAPVGRWGDLMRVVATHPNVWIKISGLGTIAADPDWTANTIEPYVAFALTQFGASRCVCGGDWPVSLLAGLYQKTWTVYRQVFATLLSPAEQRDVLFNNALRCYRLPIPLTGLSDVNTSLA